ncbi:ribonuclease H-like protein [Peniophora sp. CONT]|nr:ribonuclease H-like protein [Peniophora sp. CONT]
MVIMRGSSTGGTSPKYLYRTSPGETPGSLFCAATVILSGEDDTEDGMKLGRPVLRYKRRDQKVAPNETLVFIDGSCPRNGMFGSVGTCCVVCEPFESTRAIDDAIPAEKHGHAEETNLPEHTSGVSPEYCPATINRAKLYAAILALNAQPWAEQGVKTLVVATDLEYVVSGITNWVWRWRTNGWRVSKGKPVANRDLWEELIEHVEDLEESRVSVKFWKTARPASLGA